MGLVVSPLSLLDISVSMNQLPFAIGLVILPVTFVPAAVRPDLKPKPISFIFNPLSSVNRLVFEGHWTSFASTICINIFSMFDWGLGILVYGFW